MAIYVITASLSRNPHMTVFLHFFKSFHHLNTYLVFSCTVPSAGSPKPHTLNRGTSHFHPNSHDSLPSGKYLTLPHAKPHLHTISGDPFHPNYFVISRYIGHVLGIHYILVITFFFIFLSSLLKTEKHLDQNGSKLEKEK